MQINSFEKDKLIEICQNNDVNFLGVFGSFSRHEATGTSDVDLLVHFSKRKSLLDLIRTERKFSEILGRKVDLVTEAALSPYLAEQIKNEVAVIYDGKA